MSRESVEIVRKVYDAWSRGDPSQAFDFLDPEIVWEAIEDAPDAGSYRGHSGVKRYMADWLQDFEGFAFEFGQPVELNGRLVLEQWARNRGKGSGLQTEIHYAAVYTFRRGRVFTVKEYNSYAEALEAAARLEQGMSQENVEITRRGIEEFNQQFNSKEELDLDFLASDVAMDNSNAAFDNEVFRGQDGMRQYMSRLREMWKRQQVEPQEFIPLADDQVIVAFRFVSIGRDDVETVAHAALVVTVREGKIAHMKSFQSKSDALEAVGLSE
jgi:ketosteroid isomerase-like protein